MTITATGTRAVAAGKLATMVSQSATFIARTGALAAAGALAHVHYPWTKNKDNIRPCAIITPMGLNSDLTSTMTYVYGGKLQLRLLDTTKYPDKADALDDFINFCDGVLADILEISRTNTTGLLTIQATTDEGPAEVDPESSSEWAGYYANVIEIDWAPFQG